MFGVEVFGSQFSTISEYFLEQQLILSHLMILIAQVQIKSISRLITAGQKISSWPAAVTKVLISDFLQIRNTFLLGKNHRHRGY